MLVEEYLIESKQFNKKLNDNENVKGAFFYCQIFEHFMFFITYFSLVWFSFKALHDFYNMNEKVSLICIFVFLCVYFFVMKHNGTFKKISSISAMGTLVFITVLPIFFILPAFLVLSGENFIAGIVVTLFLLLAVCFYFINKYKSYSCSYSLIEKEEKIIAAEKKKIEEIKKVILENDNHKREAIDYLLERKNNNQELSFEELKLKNIILENEGISDHENFFILEGIIKENNRKEEVCIKNT